MKAPPGAIVSLYYDSRRIVSEGDALQTTGTGRLYLVVEVRRQKSGTHAKRWHIKALVCDSVPEGTKIHPIQWYKREKRKK